MPLAERSPRRSRTASCASIPVLLLLLALGFSIRCNTSRLDVQMEAARSKSREIPSVTIVTAANDLYAEALENLVASAKFWAPEHPVVVYNLGGLDVDKVRSWSNVAAVEWEDGIPSDYPPHVHHPKKYAWKPIILNETVHRYHSVLWLDAGSTLRGPIDPVEQVLREEGVFLVKGQDNNMELAHPSSFQYLGVPLDRTQPHYAGNTQGYTLNHYVDSIVIPNAKCALIAACIAPEGSSLSNHRYDQTTLSILAYQAHAPHQTGYLAVSRDQLEHDIRRPSSRFIWTSRGESREYIDHQRGSR